VKIYLAAKFEDKMKMRDVRAFLQNEGHEITSRWIDVEHEEDKSHTVTDAMRVEYAKMDVYDVLKADTLVAFAGQRSEPAIGGGRHVEFGIALQAGKQIIVVGPKGEHIFHWCDGVVHVADLDELAALLWGMENE
jgi:CO dehydrogenase/acetyl-CoA synthase beta subunit